MKDIKKYLDRNKSLNFNELLFSYIDRSGLLDSEVYKKVCIDRKLFSKIRCSKDYVPKKSNVIKLGLALSLNRDELDNLLSSAGYTLSTTNDFDLIIAFCVENNIYDLDVINNYLYEFCGTVLI